MGNWPRRSWGVAFWKDGTATHAGAGKAFDVVLTNNDRDLLARCLAREPSSWNQFVDRFLGLVLHIVRHTAQTHGVVLNEADSEDLTADVFLAFVDRDFAVLRRFRGRSSLATYLTVVARRVVVHRLFHDPRSRIRPPQSAGRPDPAAGLYPVLASEFADTHGGPGPEQRMGDHEEVERMIASLEPPEAIVVRMYHLEGKSYREISAQVGIPENTIGPTLSRARTKMRKSREDFHVR